MPLETDDLRQPAVLWSASGYDDDGNPEVDAASSIFVRWEDAHNEFQDSRGDVVAYDAVVYVSSVIAMESVMYLGTLAAYESAATPELYRVVGKKDIPDVKSVNFRRSVLLARLRATLPAIAS